MLLWRRLATNKAETVALQLLRRLAFIAQFLVIRLVRGEFKSGSGAPVKGTNSTMQLLVIRSL